MNIPLVRDPISKEEIKELCDWLQADETPQLSQGDLTQQFESKFSDWQGCKYSVFVNSGSAANLVMAYYKAIMPRRNSKIVIPALSWSTSLAPFLQLGYSTILCDADKDTLGLDLNHLEHIMKTQDPALLLAVNVLGFPNKYDEISKLCEKYSVELLIDDCEDAGSLYNGKRSNAYGSIVTKSFYASHLMFTIEGGMICSDDEHTYEILKMIRAHGWTKDSNPPFAAHMKKEYQIDDFNEQFTFYLPGMNCRNTQIAAFLGLNQMKKLDSYCDNKKRSYEYYQEHIKNDYWKPNPVGDRISAFAYPIITPKRKELVAALREKNIACRPLIAGSLARSPMWLEFGTGAVELPFADKVHDEGLYITNMPSLTIPELEYICETVNGVLNT